MAAPTITDKSISRSVKASTANFVFSSTVAGTYASTVIIPNGAVIISVATKANVALTNGTSFLVKVDAVTITAAIVLASANAIGEFTAQAPVLPHTIGTTAANAGGGALSITTTGTFNAGDLDVTVCYVV